MRASSRRVALSPPSPNRRDCTCNPIGRCLWGRPQPVQGLRSLDEVDDRITTAAYSFRVVETPGHTAHHVSLFEPTQRWLFSGDAYIGGEDRAWPGSYDLFGTISSLRTLASLRPERLFPGSGRVRRTPLPDIHAKIGYYTRLAEQTARLQSTRREHGRDRPLSCSAASRACVSGQAATSPPRT